jgi:hypothetical protein
MVTTSDKDDELRLHLQLAMIARTIRLILSYNKASQINCTGYINAPEMVTWSTYGLPMLEGECVVQQLCKSCQLRIKLTSTFGKQSAWMPLATILLTSIPTALTSFAGKTLVPALGGTNWFAHAALATALQHIV